MNITTYAEEARSTAIYTNQFIYPALGLSGEIGELIDKLTAGVHHKDEIIKEASDVLWYVVNICADAHLSFIDLADSINGGVPVNNFTELGVQMIASDDKRSTLIKLPIYSGRITEIAKKTIRDSGGQLPAEKKPMIAESLAEVLRCLFEISNSWSINLDDVAQANIDKLFSRRDRGVLQGSGDNR